MSSPGAWIVACAVLLGAAARAAGLFTELWLDEIWSLHLVRRASSVLDVFTRLTTENNHPINSLYLYAMRDARAWPLFRLHSLAAGLAAIGLAGVIGFRRSRRDGMLSLLLFSLSFVFVSFSSEARGYALATTFALGTLLSLQRYFRTRFFAAAALFGACAVFGFLSHFLFIHCYVAAVAWTSWKVLRRDAGRLRLADAVRLHAVPIVFLALLWLGFVRKLEEGQGPQSAPLAVGAEAAAAALGLPAGGPLAAAAAVAVLAVAAAELRRRAREGDDSWVFFGTVIFLSPALVVVALHYRFLMVRHLILSIAFFLLLFASFLANLAARGGASRAAALAAALVFAAANGAQTARFLREGRGHYLEALRAILAGSPGPRVTVAGDHDFRNLATIAFYRDYLPPGREVAYLTDDAWPTAGPEWVIVHSLSADAAPLPSVVPHGIPYVLTETYRFSGFSGMCWFVYRREGG